MERLTELVGDNWIARQERINGKYPTDRDVYNKLAEYEDLEEQGLLIKLPCKVGDVVYEANINRNIISSYRVTSIVVMEGSRNYNWELIEGIYSNLKGFNEFALGKTVFLTREEAEKTLEGAIVDGYKDA